MFKNIKILIFILIIVICLGVILYKNRPVKTYAMVNDKKLDLETAFTPLTRTNGLSRRENIKLNTGLLFLFPNSDLYSFWNDQMKFPIDVVWLDGDTVVGINQLPVDTGDNVTIYPPQKVNRVIELNKDQANYYQITPGQKINFYNLPYDIR